jgi:ABC-2 type transport system permease protein
MPESSFDSRAVAPPVISATRSMYWSVRRELWEYRSIYIAPLAVAALYLFGFLISAFRLPNKMRTALALDPMKQYKLIVQPYHFAVALIMVTTFLIALYYCLDALHGERRDRSILFWKSLPVSDLITVLSKASIPLVVIPLLSFVITVIVEFIMLLFSTAVLLASGVSVAPLWTQLSLFQMSLLLLYHLVLVHGLWYAPIYAWLLLVSGWARRAPLLWATLPLLAIAFVEKIAFGTSHFLAMLEDRVSGGAAAVPMPGMLPMDQMTHLTPGHFLSSPGLWIGLALAAAFLAAAVRVRRYRGPI